MKSTFSQLITEHSAHLSRKQSVKSTPSQLTAQDGITREESKDDAPY